jgi:uncharacterized membrane protein
MIQDPYALLAFLFAVVAGTRFLESRFHWVKQVTSAVICTLLGLALANLGVIPHTSPVLEGVFDVAIPYAVVLIVISSSFKDLKTAGRRIVLLFALAVAGSFTAGVAAGLLFSPWIGPETWKLAGQFAGAFVGGGMNFVAVGRALETSPGIFAAASVADNLSTVPYLLTQIALVRLLSRHYPDLPGVSAKETDPEEARRVWTEANVRLTDLALLAALPLFALYLARKLSPLVPGFPEVLWLTSLALGAAQLPFMKALRGAALLSYFALHLFFIALGASAIVKEVLQAGPSLFAFMIAIIAVHAVIVYGVGWLAGFDLPTISVASQAAVGGPGSALALSLSMRWTALATPGILVGIFGYGVGNYVGFACAHFLRSLG